jgi:hypothetical protein
MHTLARRLYRWAGLAVAFSLLGSPAFAQYKPRPINDPATGESYHIEVAADYWFPTADITVASAGSGTLAGLPGSQIDAKRDLGFVDQKFPALQLQLRPAKSHKLRFEYIPVSYTGSSTLKQGIVFNGQLYQVGVPVNSTFDWKTYRFGYEYDFIVKNKGFAGFIMEAKYTDVKVELDNPFTQEFAHARGPIPALGGTGRYYFVPNISLTGEVTAFKIPDSINGQYQAHYVDVDVYGTVNFTNNFGVKAGYRSVDVGYIIKADSGTFMLKGLYFGGVVRY